MYAQVEKTERNESRAVANSVMQKKRNVRHGFVFVDNRSETAVHNSANTTFSHLQLMKSSFPIQTEPSGVVQLNRNFRGGNPKGRGGKSKKYLGPAKMQPSYHGTRTLNHLKKKKMKFSYGKVVYRLLTLGGKFHFDQETLSPKDQGKAMNLILLVRAMANSIKDSPIIPYLEAIEEQIEKGRVKVNRVVLSATKEGEHGSFAPQSGILTMSVGSINKNGNLILRHPFEFFQTLVHEFTHVMDFSLRKQPIHSEIDDEKEMKEIESSEESEDYDQIIERYSEDKLSQELEAMLSSFNKSYKNTSHTIKWSEVIAHFSELGVFGLSNPLIMGFKQQWLSYYEQKYNQQKNNGEEARAYAAEQLNAFMNSIIHGIILPFVNKSGSKAVKDFFYGIIMHMPSADQIAEMGFIE